VAALLAWWVVFLVTHQVRYAAYSGLVTAAWFLPPFGSYYHDHLAFALVLGAMVPAVWRPGVPRGEVVAAMLLAAAFHAKQSIGLAGLAAYAVWWVLVIPAPARARSCGRHLLSYLAVHVFALVAIASMGDVRGYVKYTYELPYLHAAATKLDLARVASLSVAPYGVNLLDALREGGLGRALFFPVVASIFLAYGTLAVKARSLTRFEPSSLLLLTLATVWCSALLGRTFSHKGFAVGAVLAVTLFLWRHRVPRLAEYLCVVGFVAIASAFTLTNRGWPTDTAVDLGATDLAPIIVLESDLDHVYPTDLREIIAFVRTRPGGLALVDDRAFLVPLAARQAPLQPSAYFDETLSVPQDGAVRAEWQRDLIAALERHAVRLVLGPSGRSPVAGETRIAAWASLPLVHAWLDERYARVLVAGDVEVWERRE
jgi:hypothetical protein